MELQAEVQAMLAADNAWWHDTPDAPRNVVSATTPGQFKALVTGAPPNQVGGAAQHGRAAADRASWQRCAHLRHPSAGHVFVAAPVFTPPFSHLSLPSPPSSLVQLVLVDYLKASCSGCRRLHPKLLQIAAANPDALFIKVCPCGASTPAGCLFEKRLAGCRAACDRREAALLCCCCSGSDRGGGRRPLALAALGPAQGSPAAAVRLQQPSRLPPSSRPHSSSSPHPLPPPHPPTHPPAVQVDVDANDEMRALGEGMQVSQLPWFHLFLAGDLVASFSANLATVSRLRAEIAAHMPCEAPACAAH